MTPHQGPPSNQVGGGLDPSGSWRKSSYSNQDGGCIDFHAARGTLDAIRDSKHPTGPILAGYHHPLDVAAFVRWVKA